MTAVGAGVVTSTVFVGTRWAPLVVRRLAPSHPDLVAGLVLIGGVNQLPDDVFDDAWSVVEDLTDPISGPFVRNFQSSILAAPSRIATSSSPRCADEGSLYTL